MLDPIIGPEQEATVAEDLDDLSHQYSFIIDRFFC